MWQIQTQHRGEDGETIAIELRDSDGMIAAHVRWDGCMQIDLHSKTEEHVELRDTIHTCDINGLIEKLQDLQQIAQEFFDDQGVWQTKEDPELGIDI